MQTPARPHVAGPPETGPLPDHRIHGKDPAAGPGPDGSYPLICHLLDTAVVIEHLWKTRVRAGLRDRINEILQSAGVQGTTEQVLMLAAGLHDVGKANPWFQYQERENSEFADELFADIGLPRTPPGIREQMRAARQHPLRRHEFLSCRIASGAWPSSKQQIHGPAWLGVVVGGHHGYWRSPVAGDVLVGEQGERLMDGWQPQQQAHLSSIERVVGMRVADVPALPPGGAAAVVLGCFSGLLTLADWVASDDPIVASGKSAWSHRGSEVPDNALERWVTQRHEVLVAHVEKTLGKQSHATSEALRTEILDGFTPRPLQDEALRLTGSSDPGLWVCMYPTGDGKTEAALLRGAVVPTEGLFFGLPTRATTDALEARLQQVSSRLPVGTFPITKSHQFADLNRPAVADGNAGCQGDGQSTWYSSSIRKLGAQNVVGTVDQALVGALAQKHITLRLFGLANHHVVLDEVHTFDAYQTELLIELLYWWGLTRTRVTLLSATLPSEHLRLMARSYQAGVLGTKISEAELETPVEFPGTLSVSREGHITTAGPQAKVRLPPETDFHQVHVPDRSARIAEHVRWARATAVAHPTSPIAVVSNVVADCVAIAQRLMADPQVNSTHEVLCLHSSMVTGHRLAVEKRLRLRAGRQAHEDGFSATDKPLLIVGTQIIQASLDYDVDFMASDLAPAPDLIQRLGRVWRFEGALVGRAFRDGRLEDRTRTMQVVSVMEASGRLARAGAVPYLTAPLARTHDVLAAGRGEAESMLDFFQRWVDHAHVPDPLALIQQDEELARQATDEVVHHQVHRDAAGVARAALARPVSRSGRPLLAPPVRGLGSVWSDLVAMTARSTDPDVMRTRYIEQDGIVVLLMDSSGTSAWRDPTDATFCPLPVDPPADADNTWQHGEAVNLEFISSQEDHRLAMLTLPARLAEAGEAAIAATLHGKQWLPPERWMVHTRPLDLTHLPGWEYDPVLGLLKGHTSDT